jgi:hypothetical protein
MQVHRNPCTRSTGDRRRRPVCPSHLFARSNTRGWRIEGLVVKGVRSCCAPGSFAWQKVILSGSRCSTRSPVGHAARSRRYSDAVRVSTVSVSSSRSQTATRRASWQPSGDGAGVAALAWTHRQTHLLDPRCCEYIASAGSAGCRTPRSPRRRPGGSRGAACATTTIYWGLRTAVRCEVLADISSPREEYRRYGDGGDVRRDQ